MQIIMLPNKNGSFESALHREVSVVTKQWKHCGTKYSSIKEANTMGKTKNFDQMKYEVANEVGVNLKQGYNGDLTSKDAGRIGGQIVKKVFQAYNGGQAK